MSQIYFIHGTGVRDVSHTIDQLRDRGGRILGWSPDDVIPIEWGKAVGPQPLNISAALPPATRSVGSSGAPTPDDPAAVWNLLLADPYAELRVLAVGESMTGLPNPSGTLAPGAQLPSIRVTSGLQSLTIADTDAANAGLTPSQINRAAAEVASNPVVAEAADKAATYGQIVDVVARATVAVLLSSPPDDQTPTPPACYDPIARDDLVKSIANALDPGGERAWVSDLAKRVVGQIATRVAVQKRKDFMGPLSDFLRDVSFYLQHGATVRDFIASELRRLHHGGKIVLLGHSLGGIAAVDLLADPKTTSGPDALTVDLLVTVGSQAPYLYLLDSLASLSPRTPAALPFQPWLNIYNNEDLLSFCARAVFPACNDIHDEALHADVPFPAAHSAYWAQDGLYDILRRYLP